jgi:hypothetical protein
MNRSRISSKQFYGIASQAFAEILERERFGSTESKCCSFYRQVAEDIWHIIKPVRSVRLPQYNVWVFPHSPRIEPRFHELFPDELPPPNDSWCYLHSTEGVSLSQEWYSCRTETGFSRDFAARVRPALLAHALPFLDRVRCWTDLVPLIRSRYYIERIGSVAK